MSTRTQRRACHIFVTGTDTGVGKTVVSGALCEGLARLGHEVRYWKPVQTGTDEEPADALFVGELGCRRVSVVPTEWTYGPPRAPDQAAALEGRQPPPLEAVVAKLAELQEIAAGEHLVVEGAGGLLVPLDAGGSTWRDLLSVTSLAPLVVARTGLGTLNHTCLTVEALDSIGRPPLAVVLCGTEHVDNVESLRRMIPQVRLLQFPRLASLPRHPQWRDACRRLARSVLEAAGASPRNDWVALDRKHAWHPFTQHATEEEPLAIVAARGCYLYANDGRRLFDGIGSWWTNTVGHGRPEITTAMARQHRKLDHVLYAGVCHEPASRLAAQLIELLGDPFRRVFFSDNGSTAVEVALKMVRQYWVNRGQPERTRMVAFRGSYHGDTFGAMSVGAESGFFQPFRPMLFDVVWADVPTVHVSRYCPRGADSFDERADGLHRVLREHRDTVAGVIVEPLVQGAAGMLVHAEAWLKLVEQLCREYGIPLIFDEVFTGFGRVGERFAFQRAQVVPDILCLSKALTGGALPMGATVATETLFEAFLERSKERALLHGHSYTANPVACQVARRALEILVTEGLDERARAMEVRYRKWLSAQSGEAIRSPRALGSILAFELPSTEEGYFAEAGRSLAEYARDNGLYLRPLGSTVYLAPPLTATATELDDALAALERSLERVVAGGRR